MGFKLGPGNKPSVSTLHSQPRLISDTCCLRLQDRIGYCFQNSKLLERALTHPSSTAEDDSDNERMEFLGDSVVNLCVGHALYERFPSWCEGRLTQIKSAIVSTRTLAAAGQALGLREVGKLGKGLPAHEPLPDSVYANLFEAVCAAVYLDGGIEAARAFVMRILGPEIRHLSESGREPNHKSQLQQLAQKHWGLTPCYRVASANGPDHGKIFEVFAVIGSRTFPTGNGRSKKEAEQQAAQQALEILNVEVANSTGNGAESTFNVTAEG